MRCVPYRCATTIALKNRNTSHHFPEHVQASADPRDVPVLDQVPRMEEILFRNSELLDVLDQGLDPGVGRLLERSQSRLF